MITFVYRYSGTEWKIAIAGEKMRIFVARDKRIPYGRIEYRGERAFERAAEVGNGRGYTFDRLEKRVTIDISIRRNIKKTYFRIFTIFFQES